MTTDIGVLAEAMKASKKSRSKSIGPGGFDALKDTTGNRRKVRLETDASIHSADILEVAGVNSSTSAEIYP